VIVRELSVQFEGVEFWHSDIECSIRADKRVLRIVMEHLIENAHTHGFKGEPIIVSITEYRRCVELSVSGKGPTDRDRLDNQCFKRGYRSKHSGGSGLGLWIVKNYIQSMAGDINVNQLDHGEERITTFAVDLPKERVEPPVRDVLNDMTWEQQHDNSVHPVSR